MMPALVSNTGRLACVPTSLHESPVNVALNCGSVIGLDRAKLLVLYAPFHTEQDVPGDASDMDAALQSRLSPGRFPFHASNPAVILCPATRADQSKFECGGALARAAIMC